MFLVGMAGAACLDVTVPTWTEPGVGEWGEENREFELIRKVQSTSTTT